MNNLQDFVENTIEAFVVDDKLNVLYSTVQDFNERLLLYYYVV